MSKYILFFIVALCANINLSAQNQENHLPPKVFSHPDRIRYDKDCFTIEGKDVFIFSAAFHYFRCPEELWRDRFQKIKEAGFNTVETYVPWNWHERNMPKNVDDFSQCDFRDLKAWLKMAHEEFELYTIVRPGPFICAEWAGGAYPRWLAKYCPPTYNTSFWLRSDHPDHIKWSEHWYNAVCPIFEAEQITRKAKGKKGIIMMQLENEYIYFGMESDKKITFLQTLYDVSIKNKIDVPLFTCVTPEVRGSKDAKISQTFDMDNQYVWWNMHEAKGRIESLKREQPNAPAMVAELQGGWFSTVGGRLSEDSYLDGRHARGIGLMDIAGGATGLNYYMFFGGTHFAGWGARRMTTTYDYGAPLKESGGVGEKYLAVKGIGEFVQLFNDELVRSVPIEYELESPSADLFSGVRQSLDGTTFIFLLNKNKTEDIAQKLEFKLNNSSAILVSYNIKPLDSKVFVVKKGQTTGEWYPKEQKNIERPAQLPSPVRIATAYKRHEDFKTKWQALAEGVSLPELDVNDCRYSAYKSNFKLTASEVSKYGTLICDMFTADPMFVQVNNKIAKRTSDDETNNSFDIAELLKVGSNEIIAIYENQGHAHGYRPMEELSGMRKAGLGAHQVKTDNIEEWQVAPFAFDREKGADILTQINKAEGWEKIMLDAETIAGLATLQIAGLEKPKWPAAWILQDKKASAVFRTKINFTPEMINSGKTVIEFGSVDDAGVLYVNGRKAGAHNEWDKPFIINIKEFIKQGENTIDVVVRNSSGAGGILKPVRLLCDIKIEKPLQWMVAKDLSGISNNWIDGTNTKVWQKVALNTTSQIQRKGNNIQPNGENDALMTWYKIEFELPKTDKNTWIPWKIVVNASGTGYMWLNGQNIGRHWEIGPQREFYLPECWLKSGKNEKNIIVFGLRQSPENGALLNAVEIAPYSDDAEIRH